MFKFGEKSEKNLATCHKDLQLIMQESIKVSQVDFGVSEGHRSLEDQQKYYKEGKSKIDGVRQKGKHNYNPSLACDIYAYVAKKPGLAYDVELLVFLAGVITGIGQKLFDEKKTTHKIRWGGNFDLDAEILEQDFDDLPHYELIT